MKKKTKIVQVLKRILCIFMIVLTIVMSLPMVSFAQTNDTTGSTEITTEATNPIGEVLQEAIEEEQEQEQEQEETENSAPLFKISEVNLNGLTAQVRLIVSDMCTVMVAVYDEASNQLVTSGNAKADSESTVLTIQLAECELPEYYIVKAFIFDNENKPLSDVYENLDYTSRMVDFFAKTIYDFDSDYVLNIDSSIDNNFVVVNDSAKIIETSESVNTVITNDYENGVYVFDNVDETLKALQKDDIIFVKTGSGAEDFILAKATDVDVEDSRVTVESEKTSNPDDLFSFIKINTDCLGSTMAQSEEEDANGKIVIPADLYFQVSNNKKDKNATISAKAGVNYDVTCKLFGEITVSFKYYHDSENDVKICEYKATYDIGGEINVSVTGSAGITFKAKAEAPTAVGLEFFAEISFGIEFSGSVSAKGHIKYTAVNGYRNEVCKKRGINKNERIDEEPNLEVKFEEKVEAKITISLTANIGLEFLNLLKVYVQGKIEMVASVKLFDLEISNKDLGFSFPFLPWTDDDIPEKMKHDCSVCLEIDLVLKPSVCLALKVSTEDWKTDAFDFSVGATPLSVKGEIKLGKFRVSLYKGDLEIEKKKGNVCPHCEFPVAFLAVSPEENNLPIEGTVVTITPEELEEDNKFYNEDAPEKTVITTDSSGVATAYLPVSIYNYTVTNSDYEYYKTAEKPSVIVEDGPEEALLNMEKLHTVAVTVTDTENNPLSYVGVSCDDLSTDNTLSVRNATTDENGQASLRVTRGDYKFIATIPSDGRSAEMDVSVNEDTEINLQIDKGNTVTVTVLSTGGTPIEGAVVNGTTKTDANGQAKLTLDKGTYDITATFNGEKNSSNITVSGMPVSTEITLDIGYRVTFIAKSTDGTLLQGVSIDKNVQTDAEGKAVIWMKNGDYTMTVTNSDSAATQNFTVAGADLTVEFILDSYLEWEIVGTTLYIYGCGEMPDYSLGVGYFEDSYYETIDDEVVQPWWQGYKYVTDIVVGEGITYIGNFAFTEFTELKTVQLPDTLLGIGDNVFDWCDKLVNINFPNSLRYLYSFPYKWYENQPDGLVFAGNVFLSYKGKMPADTKLVLPEGTTGLARLALEGQDNLVELTIPKSVRFIDDAAVSSCYNLETVYWNAEKIDYSIKTAWEWVGSIFHNSGKNTENGLNVVFGETVKEIYSYLFYECEYLKTVTLQANITKIGYAAFYNCTGLENVYWDAESVEDFELVYKDHVCTQFSGAGAENFTVIFGENVKRIPKGAFTGCANLHKIIVNSVALNDDFVGSSYYSDRHQFCDYSLEEVILGDKVKRIPSNMFFKQSLKEIVIPDSVEYIGRYAFYNCSELESIKLSDGLECIDDYALSCCDKLERITIPESLQTFGEGVVSGCDNLKTIYWNAQSSKLLFDYNNNFLGDANAEIVFDEKVHTIPKGLFNNRTNLAELNIPESITTISDGAFERCTGLVHIEIPKSVTHIGTDVFRECINLKSVNILNETIGANMFYNCTGLTDVLISENLTTIDTGAFYECTNLTSIIIPEGVKSIESFTFYGCTNLSDVSLAEGVVCIGQNSFNGCKNLESMNLPDSVEHIGVYAFNQCTNLASVKLPISVECSYIAFKDCLDIENLVFSKGSGGRFISVGGNSPWSGLSKSLKEVVFESGVNYISSNMFLNCTSLIDLTVSDSVKEIGDKAFYGCTALKGLTLPDSLQYMGMDAFSKCSALESLELPASLGFENYSFNDCTALKKITLTKGNGNFFNYGEMNYKNTPWYSNGSVNEIIIKDGVNSIGSCAFYNQKNITNITIPDSVKTIGGNAFSGCSGLTDILIPDSVSCIGDLAFSGCTELVDVTIPENVISIGINVFSGCTGLKTVYWNAKEAHSEEYYYLNLDVEIILGENVERIPSGLFYNRDDIMSIVIPEKVKYIDSYAFFNCKNLKSIVLPDSVCSIDKYAFYGCNGFDRINIPENVSYIGDRAFYDCINVTELIWNSVECDIGDCIFSGLGSNTNGTTVTFGEKVKTVSQETLNQYYYDDNILNVKNIIIGPNVKQIDNSAFGGCVRLEKVYWNAISCDDLRDYTYLFYGAGSDSDGIEVVFGESVKSIPDYALNRSEFVKSIIIGSNVESIGKKAFGYCENLEKVYWNARNVADFEVDDAIFSETGKSNDSIETEIIFGKNVETIPANILSGYNRIEVITIDANINCISDGAFKHGNYLTTINIPSSVKAIGKAAFYDCYRLSSVNYQGSESDWKKITIGHSNPNLLNTTINYNSYTPAAVQNEIVEVVKTEEVSLAEPMSLMSMFGLNNDETDSISEVQETETAEEENIVQNGNTVTVESATSGNSYVLLIVKSDEAEDLLSSDNILYIDQKVAETDTLTFSFALRENCADYKTVVTNAYVVVPDCEKSGHSYGEYVADINNKATCLKAGKEYAVCSKCGIMSFRDVEALGHKEYVEIEGTDATCTTDGITDRISCETCGTVLVEQQTIKAEHSYSDWQVTVKPTEETDGEKQRVCSVCSETETKIVRAEPILEFGVLEKARIYIDEITYLKFVSPVTGEFSIVSESNYDVVGYLFDENKSQLAYNDDGEIDTDFEIVYNLVEGVTYYVGIKSYGGNYGSTVSVQVVCPHEETYDREAVESTCTEKGHTAGIACALCNGWISGDYINVIDHSFKKWTIVKEATCTEKGEKTSECDVCGYITTKEVPVSHSDDDWNGTCESCGEVFSDILIGQTIDLDIPVDENVYIKFTPFISGEYELKLSKSGNCNIGICDQEKFCWSSVGGGSSLSEYLEAGKTYYWRLYSFVDEPYKVSVTLNVSNAECEHISKTSFDAIEATCTTDGYTVGEKCNICTSWVNGHELIPAFGHLDDNLDGICETCNEQTGEIRVDQVVSVDIKPEETIYFKCIFPASGEYRLSIETDAVCKIGLCDERKFEFSSSTGGSGSTEVLDYNNEYYWSIRTYSEETETVVVRFTCLESYCDHKNTTRYDATESTCTESGYSEGVYCNDCESWISGHKKLPLAHEDSNGDGKCEKCGNNVSDILVGETKTIEVAANEISYLKFVPAESGIYTFTSKADNDTYGYLYDCNKEILTSDDDSGDSSNFSITYELLAGQTYYWGARFYDEEDNGLFDVVLKCDEVFCKHKNTTEHDTVESTCTEEGYTEGVYCDDCEKWISGHEIIPMHTDENKDGTCDICLAELSDIYPGKRKSVIVEDDKTVLLKFIPSQSGRYSFRSYDSEWITIGLLYDADMNLLKSCEEHIDENDNLVSEFLIRYDFDKGKTYYLGATYNRGNSEQPTASEFEVCLTLEEAYCNHEETVEVSEKAPDCINDGNTAGTKCTICGKLITAEVIGALGHTDTNSDDICDVCGQPANDIEVGVPITIDTNEEIYLKFIPVVSGRYTLTANAEYCNNFATLYDYDDNELAYSYNGGANDNFSLTYALEAGQTYYFEISCWELDEFGEGCNFDVLLTLDENSCQHEETTVIEATESTCTTSGYEEGIYCLDCETWLSGHEEIPATGHNYNSVVIAPTCTTMGYTTHTCEKCGEGYTDEFINAKKHNYTSKVMKSSTCTATGIKTFTCICGDTYTETIAKLGHKYSSSYTTDKKATCSVEGSKSKHCTRSGCTAKTSVTAIAKLTHTYDNNCDKTCNVCKATRSISHSYKNVTTNATLTKNGKVESKCSVCGYVSKTTTIYYPKTIKLSATSYTYNGKVKSPTVTVKDSKGNALKKDTDYTVSYASGRKNTGKYSVTVTFKGKYSGKKVLYFNILPSKTSKITPTCGTTSIKASWKKVTGASGYMVELLNSKGEVVKSATTTKTAYTFKSLSKVTTYKVRVTAYKTIDSKKVYSTSYTTITTSTAPAKVTLSKVTAGSKQATPAWKTVSGASGYEVQYSTSSKFKSAKTSTVKKGSTKKTTIKKLTKGKKYYFKVRAYKSVDGNKVYGAWSAVKSVKVK